MLSVLKTQPISRYEALALDAGFGRFIPYLIIRYTGGQVEQKCLRERSFGSQEDAVAHAHRYAQQLVYYHSKALTHTKT